MLIGLNYKGIDASCSVDYRMKSGLKAAVAGTKAPGLHIIVAIKIKINVVELVSEAIIKKHVFARSGGITETITDVETEGLSINALIAGTPVPGIVISPYSPPPVQGAPKFTLPLAGMQLIF